MATLSVQSLTNYHTFSMQGKYNQKTAISKYSRLNILLPNSNQAELEQEIQWWVLHEI